MNYNNMTGWMMLGGQWPGSSRVGVYMLRAPNVASDIVPLHKHAAICSHLRQGLHPADSDVAPANRLNTAGGAYYESRYTGIFQSDRAHVKQHDIFAASDGSPITVKIIW